MEIRYLVKSLLKKWWLIIPTFVAVVAATALFTYTQAPVYESSSTYVVKVESGATEDFLSAVALDDHDPVVQVRHGQCRHDGRPSCSGDGRGCRS